MTSRTPVSPFRFELTDRLRELAAAAVARVAEPPGCRRRENQKRAYFEVYADRPLRERQARSLAYAMVREPVLLFPGERLHGMFYHGSDPQWSDGEWGEHSAAPAAARRVRDEVPEIAPLANQWPEVEPRPGQSSYLIDGGGIPGHIAWNWHLVLEHGIDGLAERHRAARAATDDPEARAYYDGVLILYEAVLEWNARHVAELRRLLAEATDPVERARLADSVAVCERVPAYPARTFREAVQSFYFAWLAVMHEVPYGGNSPGRFDWFLWPWLRDELESGAISYQDAGELIAELFIKLDERVHYADGHVNTIVLGGQSPDGSNAVTPLSHLCLEVFEQLDLTHPAVYTRLSEVNPPEWIERSVRFLMTGGNRAQLLIDEAIVAAMSRDGRLPVEDARQYICGGCMELNPHGMNSDEVFSFTWNIPKQVELLVTGGECLTTGQRRLAMAGSLAECGTFEELYAVFEAELHRTLAAKVRCLDIYSEELARCRPAFLQSSLVHDCLERGRNLQDGGARYNDYGGTPLGLANVADALYAVEQAIYAQRLCAVDELLAALRADFVGHERLHRRLLAFPKYGSGDSGADAMMQRVTASVCAVFEAYPNRFGRPVKPIIFTFTWAPEMGRSLGASPDGRRAGQPIAHGLTPQGIGMADGLASAMLSYGTLPNHLVRGGASTMWDLDGSWVDLPAVRAVVGVFRQLGGQIFQGNTTPVAELLDALDHPEAHPNLIVRVGGYSARFVNLPRPLQLEIVERTRHR